LRTAAAAVLVGICTGTFSPGRAAIGHSRVTRLDVLSRRLAFGGAAFGNVGAYELLIARAQVVIDPAARENAGIVDLDRAPRNAHGLVEYSFDVQILKPVDIIKGNRAMLYEVNNRGTRLVFQYFNGRDVGYEARDIGNGYVMRHGFTAVWSGWLTSSAAGTSDPPAVFARLPVATNSGAPLVSTAREEWLGDHAGKPGGRLTYPAATLDQAKATLTYRHKERDPRQSLSASDWSYGDDRHVKVTPPRGSGSGTIYEFIYPAKDPVVTGLGYAAIRDLVSYLRYSATDDAGHPNPLYVNGRPVLEVAVSGVQRRHGGPKGLRRHQPHCRCGAPPVRERPLCPAGPYHDAARESPVSHGRIPLHLSDDH
jgi:hypothetical protein